MSLTTFSGPVESLEGGFVITGPGDYILNGNGSFTTFGEGQFRIDTTAGPDAGGIIINNGRLTARRLDPATGGGNIAAIGGGIRATDTNFNLSSGAGYLTDSNYIGIIVDSTGGIREVSGVAVKGQAFSGPEAGIIGTAKAYSTNLSRTSSGADGISISTIYIDIGNLTKGVSAQLNLNVIGKDLAGFTLLPAYIFQAVQGPDTQLGEIISATMTCIVPPYGNNTSYSFIGLAGSEFGYLGQGEELPGTQIDHVIAKNWQPNETVQLLPSNLLNDQYLYLMQGISSDKGTYVYGLFRFDFYSIDI